MEILSNLYDKEEQDVLYFDGDSRENVQERYELARERILSFDSSEVSGPVFGYFEAVRDIIASLPENCFEKPVLKASVLKPYEDAAYDSSWACHSSAYEKSEDYGPILSAVLAELIWLLPLFGTDRATEFVEVLETIIQFYVEFQIAAEESHQPKKEELSDILFCYLNDYLPETEQKLTESLSEQAAEAEELSIELSASEGTAAFVLPESFHLMDRSFHPQKLSGSWISRFGKMEADHAEDLSLVFGDRLRSAKLRFLSQAATHTPLSSMKLESLVEPDLTSETLSESSPRYTERQRRLVEETSVQCFEIFGSPIK